MSLGNHLIKNACLSINMILLMLYFLLPVCNGEVYKTVKTSQGVLSGNFLASRDGRKYAAFSKIPFGRPPVGKLRFMPAEKAVPWVGVLDATEETPKCLQHSILMEEEGQEDCLYLNVYTPNVNASLPVIFYVFGGAFVTGEVLSPENNAFFMDEDVVIVTPNHRLGTLGFLSLGTEKLPGNIALKDLILALTWTYQEIANFGGNPELITAMGLSSGAALAHYLCSSSRAQGLLKGCISLSGVGGAPWSLQSPITARISAYSVGAQLGCMPWNYLPCLQAQPAEKLLSIQPAFRPVIEPQSSNAVITEWPSRVNNFPWLTGHTANEGLLITSFPGFKTSKLAQHIATIVYYLRYPLSYCGSFGFHSYKICKIYQRFFENNDFFTGLEKVISESLFIYPALKEITRHYGPKYFYVFTYSGGPSLHELWLKHRLNITGVGHGDDYVYFSNDPVYKSDYKPPGWPSKRDIDFSKYYVKMLVTFAREHTPSQGNMPKWRDFSTSIYNQLDNYGIYRKEYTEMKEIIAFWDNIF